MAEAIMTPRMIGDTSVANSWELASSLEDLTADLDSCRWLMRRTMSSIKVSAANENGEAFTIMHTLCGLLDTKTDTLRVATQAAYDIALAERAEVQA